MREFILLALKAHTTPDFDELAEAGRMDVVCRTVTSTFWLSDSFRKDTVLHVALSGPKDPPKLISFYGYELPVEMKPDEKSIGEFIKKALRAGMKLKLNEEATVVPGIKVSKKAFETLIKEKAESRKLVYLHQRGEDIRKSDVTEDCTFVLGDFIGLPKNTESLLDRYEAEKMSVGPKELFASHCITLVHNELDRRA